MDPLGPKGNDFNLPPRQGMLKKSIDTKVTTASPEAVILGTDRKPGLFTKIKDRIRPPSYEKRMESLRTQRDELDAAHAEMIKQREAFRTIQSTPLTGFDGEKRFIKNLKNFQKIASITVNGQDVYGRKGKTEVEELSDIVGALKENGENVRGGSAEIFKLAASFLNSQKSDLINLKIQMHGDIPVMSS